MRQRTATVAALILLASVLPAGDAAADSIYLRNGRVIRAENAHIDGDRVVFYLHGARQTIPLSMVDRVEADDWRPPGSDLAAATEEPPDTDPSTPSFQPPTLGDIAPGARLDALAGYLGGGAEANQALGLLQSLASLQGNDGGAGATALMPLLGALGGTDSGGGLGSLGSDLQQLQAILPALTRLGAALFAPEYSATATDAAARDLLDGLAALGVSDEEVRARARQFGLPEDLIERIGRR